MGRLSVVIRLGVVILFTLCIVHFGYSTVYNSTAVGSTTKEREREENVEVSKS
jgi:hypothetical protein